MIPASSPAKVSITSVRKPLRSAQRKYIRRSILAQSWASVPPAPEWIETMALFRSFSPPSIRLNSAAWRSFSTWSILAETSFRVSSSFSSFASSKYPFASSISAFSFSQSSTPPRSAVLSLRIFCAPSLSFQKSGLRVSCSIAARRAILASKSKMTSEGLNLFFQKRNLIFDFVPHGLPF